MKETILYKKLDAKKVKCNVCSHNCTVLPGKRGKCGVRENMNGKLTVLNYGKLVSVNPDPIEKKPLFHFLPGSISFSIACAGCNFSCGHCQNWQISQIKDLIKEKTGEYNKLMPGQDCRANDVVDFALKTNSKSISYTYTEPTIYAEFALDTMKIAREEKLKNVWVTNGFMTRELLEKITPFLDAANVDLKSISEKFYTQVCKAKLRPVLENIKQMKKSGVWIELTTLIIPGYNDSNGELEKIADFISNEVGNETPWHISKFSPEISYKMQNIRQTDEETIKKAVEIGKKNGLKYVYSGNIATDSLEDTKCPKCTKKIVDRNHFYEITINYYNALKCPKCGEKLDFIWK